MDKHLQSAFFITGPGSTILFNPDIISRPHNPHFTGEENEAPRSWATCQNVSSYQAAKVGFKPRSAWPQDPCISSAPGYVPVTVWMVVPLPRAQLALSRLQRGLRPHAEFLPGREVFHRQRFKP